MPTPLTSFGHGNGPAFGEAARARFAGTNTPMGAYLDLAAREGAEIVTPVAAEAWPSNKTSRATFEALVRPLEDAVRAGCDAAMLDLHGAMVIEDCDDAEGEIVRRLRAIAPQLPIAVTLDYHTNLSAELVDNATVITGYKTYPHVDMYEVGQLAGEILLRALDGEIEPVMAWGWLPLLASIMRHAPEDGPSGDILRYARAMEASGKVLAATPAAVVSARRHAVHRRVGDRRRRCASRRRQPPRARFATACWRSPGSGAPSTRSRTAAGRIGRAARRLGEAAPGGPVLLIDHCDNCGSGGAQDVMAVVAEILRQRLDDVAIAPIRDPGGGGADDRRRQRQPRPAVAGRTYRHALDRPRGEPLEVSGKVGAITDGEFTITGPMYTGIRTFLGRTAVLEVDNAGRENGDRRHRARARADGPGRIHPLRHRPLAPKRYIMLKSRIHYRAGFKPIASHIVECAGAGVTNADLSVYRYRKLTRPIFPLDPI